MSEVKKETKTKKTTKKPAAKKEETKVVKKVAEKKETTKKVEKVEVKEEKKEKKESKALMDNKSQIYYRSLSKIIKILAKIARIALMILVPFIFLGMIMIPIIFKGFEVEGNIVRVDDATIIISNDKLTVKINNEAKTFKADARDLDTLVKFLNENSKGSIITFIELSMLLLAIVLILDIYILSNLEKMFANFVKQKTPFTKENSKYIFKIVILMCVIKFINFCLTTAELNAININSISILGILIVFVIYIVFNYAVKLQEQTNDRLYE